MLFKGSNPIATAAVLLLMAGTCFAGQNSQRREQRLQKQDQKKEQRQEQREENQQQEHRGFQPPQGKSSGFGPAANPGNNGVNPQQPPASQPQQPEVRTQPQRPQGLRVFGPGPHAGDWLRRNRNLPLNQQLQQLQNDPAFRHLSPDEQRRLEGRVRQFNSMSPAEQDRVLNNMDAMEHMPPDARRQAHDLYHRYQGLPFTRQQAVSSAVRELNTLPPEERQQRLSSPEFRARFTDNECEIISQRLQLPQPGESSPGQPPE